MNSNKTLAHAIRIGGRYFYQFGKGGRVLTAWTLGGGKLFFSRSEELDKTVEKIKAKGKKPEVVTFELVEEQKQPKPFTAKEYYKHYSQLERLTKNQTKVAKYIGHRAVLKISKVLVVFVTRAEVHFSEALTSEVVCCVTCNLNPPYWEEPLSLQERLALHKELKHNAPTEWDEIPF